MGAAGAAGAVAEPPALVRTAHLAARPARPTYRRGAHPRARCRMAHLYAGVAYGAGQLRDRRRNRAGDRPAAAWAAWLCRLGR